MSKDREFMLLSDEDKIKYLNEHNYGEFRPVTDEESKLIVSHLKKKYPNETFRPYAFREESNDVVVVNNTQGMYGKCYPRLFVNIEGVLP